MSTEYEELSLKYHKLLNEYIQLKAENTKLKAQLHCPQPQEAHLTKTLPETDNQSINNYSASTSKIELFLSLFKGRSDVFATRWKTKSDKAGYSPSCQNDWEKDLCPKPLKSCSSFMQCGNILYRDDAKKQADKRPFSHFVIPRFTSLQIPEDKTVKENSITTLFAEVITNEFRNQMIISDVISCHNEGRNCLVLTDRKAHVDLLYSNIKPTIPDTITLTGGRGISETKSIMKTITETPADRPLTIIATGKFIGEGFDEPRLDTLFLTMPISWKGTLQQYAGRLHRLYDSKKDVQIFDYIDIHVKMLERMYQKRLNGYASIGYKVKGSINNDTSPDFIFDRSSFLPVYRNDIINATSEIMIVIPFIRKNRAIQIVDYWRNDLHKNVTMTIVTRPLDNFREVEQSAVSETVSFLQLSGVKTIFKSDIHQKFAIIDNWIVWYGSINLLSFGNAEESIMRLENTLIAKELIRNLDI